VQIKLTPHCLEAVSGVTEFQHSSVGGTALYKDKQEQCAGFSTKFPISNLSSTVYHQTV
jgi:hypothetical protein